jgi:hemerythrin
MASTPFEVIVGHDVMDAQHQAISRHVTDVRRAVGACDRDATRRALSALWDETVGHFATEEALMEESAYPERNAHRTAHLLFLEDLKALVRELDQHGLTEDVGSWALQRVPEWITFHIETNDAPLARFLARRAAARLLKSASGGESDAKPTRRDA